MNNLEIKKNLIKKEAKRLNNLFNFYLIIYFILAIGYGMNAVFHFISYQYSFAFILFFLCLIMKPMILYSIAKINNLMNRTWWSLGLITLFLPFGEVLSANIMIRKSIELLTKDDEFRAEVPGTKFRGHNT